MCAKDIYSYENRQEIYNEARESFLQGKPFEINGKMCESLIEIMHEDVSYLFSCLEDIKEVVVDNEKGKRKDIKVGNTPFNKQLADTINMINKRILDAEKQKRELGEQMEELINLNKGFQTKLKEQTKMYGCGNEKLFVENEKLFKNMSKILSEFVNGDVISIQFVKYRNNWIKEYEKYQKDN